MAIDGAPDLTVGLARGIQDAVEGERALAELARLPKPTMSDHGSRETFRALARANEGAGHDAQALKWYSDFVQFGSGFTDTSTCSGCP